MRQGLNLTGGVMLMALALGGCDKAPEASVTAAGTTASEAASSGPVVQGPERRIVALGDSLLAGYGLRAEQAYPPRLEAALRAGGVNARVVNAGVSGDTTADGLARVDFTLGAATPDLVLISLGGNDMLRGLPVAQTKANLDALLTRLDQRHVKVVLLGMMAAPNMGAEYGRAFDAVFPDLAKKHHAALVPLFVSAINGKAGMQLPDHIHPTPQGVEAMVKDTLPVVEGALPRGG